MPVKRREDRQNVLDQRLTILVSPKQRTRLDRAAEEAGLSVAEVVRRRVFGEQLEEGCASTEDAESHAAQ